MKISDDKIVKILKILIQIDNVEIIKTTLESLIEDIEDYNITKKSQEESDNKQ